MRIAVAPAQVGQHAANGNGRIDFRRAITATPNKRSLVPVREFCPRQTHIIHAGHHMHEIFQVRHSSKRELPVERSRMPEMRHQTIERHAVTDSRFSGAGEVLASQSRH